MDTSIKIKLSFQRALLGNVSPHLRGICCDWDDAFTFIHVIFYIDVEANQQEQELLDAIMTEFSCDFPEVQTYKEELIYSLESFERLNKLKLIIYWRNEL